MTEQDELSTFLSQQLERVNYFVSFGEAKNAAIVAMNVAVLCELENISSSGFFIKVILALLLCSIAISIISFLPKMNKMGKKERTLKKNNDTNRNLIFYKDISSFENEEDYILEVCNKYLKKECTKEKNNMLYLNFAEEIIVNSKIACAKYNYFKISVIIDLAAIILLFFTIIM